MIGLLKPIGVGLYEIRCFASTYVIGVFLEQQMIDNSVTQEVVQLRTNLACSQNAEIVCKVNAVGLHGKISRQHDTNSKEKVKYLDEWVVGFQAKGQWSNQDKSILVKEIKFETIIRIISKTNIVI